MYNDVSFVLLYQLVDMTTTLPVRSVRTKLWPIIIQKKQEIITVIMNNHAIVHQIQVETVEEENNTL